MGELKIIGTSHIAKQSLQDVQKAVEEGSPDIIALELDKERLQALFSKERHKPRLRDIRHIGVKGYLFLILGEYMERKMGDYVGVKPGSEMKLAAKLAKEKQLGIALIDRHIRITLKRLSKAITIKVILRFIWDIIAGFFTRKKLQFDLKTVPQEELILKILEETKQKYPGVYNVLVHERNVYMARRLIALMRKEPEKKILAVMGAGHVKEVQKIVDGALLGAAEVG